jgi:hypothetical protein
MVNSVPPAGKTVPSRDQIIAENAAINTRNQARQARRNKGELNVDNDESLLTVPPMASIIIANQSAASTSQSSLAALQRPSTPAALPPTPSPLPVSSNAGAPSEITRMIAAFQKLSPSKRATVQSLISNAPTTPIPISLNVPPTYNSSSSSPSFLFDISNERPSVSSLSDTYGIHTYILDLARHHQHIPFSLLTTKATTRLFLESSALKFIMHYPSHRNSATTKCHLIDVTQFPAESSISIPEWHEAWARYLILLQDHASPEILDRWSRHYKELREHRDFADNWAAILAFDVEQRATYAADPQAFDEAKYHRQFDDIKVRVLRDESLKVVSDALAQLKSHRYEPYPAHDPTVRKSSSSERPFRGSSKLDGERLPPLCLCCGNLGHTFPGCTSSATPSGTTPHSKVANKQLVCRATPNTKYCIDFNIYCNGKRVCTKRTHKGGEIHACSLCGSADHGACSRKCLGI